MNKLQRRSRLAKILILARKGLTPIEIAKAVPANADKVRQVFHKYGLPLEGSGGKNRKVTENFLTTLGDKEYYFIGYLASDGNIHRTSVSLYSMDISHLEQFREYYKQPFNYYYYKTSIGTPMVQLHFGNKKIVEWLYSTFNITPNKSKTLALPTMNWALLRGIFDGDGSAKKEFKITTASNSIVNLISNFLLEYGIKCKIRIKGINKDCYDIVVPAKFHVKFVYYLYKNSTIHMPRKYNDSCALLSKYNKEKWDKLLEG